MKRIVIVIGLVFAAMFVVGCTKEEKDSGDNGERVCATRLITPTDTQNVRTVGMMVEIEGNCPFTSFSDLGMEIKKVADGSKVSGTISLGSDLHPSAVGFTPALRMEFRTAYQVSLNGAWGQHNWDIMTEYPNWDISARTTVYPAQKLLIGTNFFIVVWPSGEIQSLDATNLDKINWSHDTGAALNHAVVDGDYIYAAGGATKRTIVKINALTGEFIWSKVINVSDEYGFEESVDDIAVDKYGVYVSGISGYGIDNGYIEKRDKETGELLWQNLSYELVTMFAINNVGCFGIQNWWSYKYYPEIKKFDCQTGQGLWGGASYYVDDDKGVAIGVRNDFYIAGGATIEKRDVATGALVKSIGDISAGMVYSDGESFYVFNPGSDFSLDGRLRKYDFDFNLLWSRMYEYAIRDVKVGFDGYLYIIGDTISDGVGWDGVYRVDPATGEPK